MGKEEIMQEENNEQEKSDERLQQEQRLRQELNAEAEEDIPDKIKHERTEDIIDSYKDRWNIDDDKRHYVSDNSKARKNFPHDAEIGDEWEDPQTGKVFEKTGKDNWAQKGRKNRFNMRECGKCGRFLTNKNEISVNLQTGKCYKCHAREEKEKIAKGKEYEPPSWKKEIVFTDTMGNKVMNIDEVIQEYGELVGHGVLTQLVEGMDRMREEGKNVNEAMYENALSYIDRLEDEIGEVDHEEIRNQMRELKEDMEENENQKLKKHYDLSEK